jgi:hypothetical protein
MNVFKQAELRGSRANSSPLSAFAKTNEPLKPDINMLTYSARNITFMLIIVNMVNVQKLMSVSDNLSVVGIGTSVNYT